MLVCWDVKWNDSRNSHENFEKNSNQVALYVFKIKNRFSNLSESFFPCFFIFFSSPNPIVVENWVARESIGETVFFVSAFSSPSVRSLHKLLILAIVQWNTGAYEVLLHLTHVHPYKIGVSSPHFLPHCVHSLTNENQKIDFTC